MNTGARAAIYRDVEGKRHKRCPCCLQYFPLDRDHFHNGSAGRRDAYCKACRIRYVRAWQRKREDRDDACAQLAAAFPLLGQA